MRERVLALSRAWQWVPPGAEMLVVADVPVVDYPSWAGMGFYAMPGTLGDPESAIAAVCAEARSRGRASCEWWVAPDVEPADLGQRLVERGAVESEVTEILAYDLAQGAPDVPVPDDVSCVVVMNADQLDDAENVAAAVWGGGPSSGERRAAQRDALGEPLRDQGEFRVVGYLGSTPFATAGCQLTDGVARLYAGCVLPGWRGRGGYRATLRTRLEVAHAHGARLALVRARVDTSRPVLTLLGFTSYGEGRLYSLPV